jgi:hypothetical protein
MIGSTLLSALVGAISAIIIMMFKEIFQEANKRRKVATRLGAYLKDWSHQVSAYRPWLLTVSNVTDISLEETGGLSVLTTSELTKRVEASGYSIHNFLTVIQQELLNKVGEALDATIKELSKTSEKEYEHLLAVFDRQVEDVRNGLAFLPKDAWDSVPAQYQPDLIGTCQGMQAFITTVRHTFVATQHATTDSNRVRDVLAMAMAHLFSVHLTLKHSSSHLETLAKRASKKGLTRTLLDIVVGC